MFKSEPTKEISLFNHPKLQQAKAINMLSDALGSLKRFFLYGELRGQVLLIYFSHPIGVSEFGFKREQILEQMRTIYKQNNLRETLIFRDVKAVCKVARKEPTVSKDDSYKELASGEFDTSGVQNEHIKRAFERIKQHIKANREGKDD